MTETPDEEQRGFQALPDETATPEESADLELPPEPGEVPEPDYGIEGDAVDLPEDVDHDREDYDDADDEPDEDAEAES